MRVKKLEKIFLIFSIFWISIFGIKIDKTISGIILFYHSFFFNRGFISFKEIEFILASFLTITLIFFSLLLAIHCLNIIRIKVVYKLFNELERLSREFTFSLVLVVSILMISITAPIISTDDPAYHKDVMITKLLPPLSRVNFIQKKTTIENLSDLEFLRKKLFENLYEENRIYFTNIELNDSIVIVHKGKLREILNLTEIETINQRPKINSKIFIAGTDEFGRDLFSRLIFGIRISVFIGLLSVLVSFLIGSVIGYIAGISGGLIDNLLMRLVDFFLSFPVLFFVVFLIAFVGNSIHLLIIVFGFSGWMFIARLARNESIACSKKEFVQTLILAGQSKFKIVVKHILPNTISPILITLIFQMNNVVIAESALSFLGLGVQPPTPTLGGIIKSGYDYLSINGWIAFVSSIILISIILSFNLFAEGLKKNFTK